MKRKYAQEGVLFEVEVIDTLDGVPQEISIDILEVNGKDPSSEFLVLLGFPNTIPDE